MSKFQLFLNLHFWRRLPRAHLLGAAVEDVVEVFVVVAADVVEDEEEAQRRRKTFPNDRPSMMKTRNNRTTMIKRNTKTYRTQNHRLKLILAPNRRTIKKEHRRKGVAIVVFLNPKRFGFFFDEKFFLLLYITYFRVNAQTYVSRCAVKHLEANKRDRNIPTQT